MADLSRPPGLAPHPDDPWRCHPPLPSVSPAAPLTYGSPPIPHHSLLITVLTHSRRSSSSPSPRLTNQRIHTSPNARHIDTACAATGAQRQVILSLTTTHLTGTHKTRQTPVRYWSFYASPAFLFFHFFFLSERNLRLGWEWGPDVASRKA